MWQAEQDLLCPGCGQPTDEAWVFSPDEQDAKVEAYKAGHRLCGGCKALDDHAKFHPRPEGVSGHGFVTTLRRERDG